jgi:hypothetical protein
MMIRAKKKAGNLQLINEFFHEFCENVLWTVMGWGMNQAFIAGVPVTDK